MKLKIIALSLAVVLSLSYSNYVLANEGQEHQMPDGTMMKDDDMAQDQMNQEATKAVEVGNKICPVSGEKVGEMGEIVKHEYNGKIYNLCCKACAKDFKKDPEKYSKIAEDEVAKEKEENLDPHLDHNHNNS